MQVDRWSILNNHVKCKCNTPCMSWRTKKFCSSDGSKEWLIAVFPLISIHHRSRCSTKTQFRAIQFYLNFGRDICPGQKLLLEEALNPQALTQNRSEILIEMLWRLVISGQTIVPRNGLPGIIMMKYYLLEELWQRQSRVITWCSNFGHCCLKTFKFLVRQKFALVICTNP